MNESSGKLNALCNLFHSVKVSARLTFINLNCCSRVRKSIYFVHCILLIFVYTRVFSPISSRWFTNDTWAIDKERRGERELEQVDVLTFTLSMSWWVACYCSVWRFTKVTSQCVFAEGDLLSRCRVNNTIVTTPHSHLSTVMCPFE